MIDMIHKTGFLDRARRLDTKIRVKHEVKKQIKRHCYQIFLNEKAGYLPNRKKLYSWRNKFILAAMICLLVPSLQTIFFYDTIWIKPSVSEFDTEFTIEQIWVAFCNEIPGIFGAVFLILLYFGFTVDWIIYRRWGNQFTIMKW